MIFCVTLWAAAKEFFNEIESDLSGGFQVVDSRDYYFSTWENYDQFILDIYEPDSMPTWKIEKKVERMRQYKRVARMINIDIPNPNYRTKSNGMPISIVTENIKRAIRERYSFLKTFEGKPDVIIHMGDTHDHTSYLNEVFEKHGKAMKCKLDIGSLLSSLKKYEYFLIKRDTPYNPPSFPSSYAVGKDLDVIVKKDDLKSVKEEVTSFAEKNKGKFNLNIIEEKNGFRVRFEENDMLHYQIDVSTSVPGVSEKFLQKCFEEKLLVNRAFYELPTRYEAVLRVASLSRKPSKIHHYVFLRNNISKIELDVFEDSNHRTMVEEFIRSNS
tara:strand:+ start:442 stop:1425 length:984 start_codon:yes stop_codon:yes gene_type:complete